MLTATLRSLAEGFVYLAAILGAFSRKVVGWTLADHLEAGLAIDSRSGGCRARRAG